MFKKDAAQLQYTLLGFDLLGFGTLKPFQKYCLLCRRAAGHEIGNIHFVLTLSPPFTGVTFQAGKVNITTFSPGLFACKTITFAQPFTGGKEVKVFASFAHSTKRPTVGNGGSIWVESEDNSRFTTCVSEYGEGSEGSAEVNWIAVQSVPTGAERGTAALDSWTTGTKCKSIDFHKVGFLFLLKCLSQSSLVRMWIS